MKLYINTKVLWGLVGSILFIIGLGILSYQFFHNLTEATQWTNHARRVIQSVDEVRSTIVRIERDKSIFLLTGDNRFVRSVKSNVSTLNALLSDLETTTRDNPTQQSNIKEVRPLISAYVASLSDIKKLDSAGVNDNIEQILVRTREEEQSLILSRSLSVQKDFRRFVYAFVGLIIVTTLVLTGLVWLINANSKSRSIAEQKLRDAELETKKINQDLESFSYSVSHDLRAPLRSIDGYSQILIEDYSEKLDSEGHRLLMVIINNARKMSRLIDDLLEFSRLGRSDINRTKVDIDEQVKAISDELLEPESHRKIDLKIHPMGTAMIDPVMMRQVWINLIGNALKYSRRKEIAIIEIGRKVEDHKTIFFVKDNGAGFDMTYTKKLFGVFQRLHKANEFEGTGVGLALVKRIIEKHNGKVWAEAKLDEGATFYFTLPTENSGAVE